MLYRVNCETRTGFLGVCNIWSVVFCLYVSRHGVNQWYTDDGQSNYTARCAYVSNNYPLDDGSDNINAASKVY